MTEDRLSQAYSMTLETRRYFAMSCSPGSGFPRFAMPLIVIAVVAGVTLDWVVAMIRTPGSGSNLFVSAVWTVGPAAVNVPSTSTDCQEHPELSHGVGGRHE